jgi:hypothetical protein
VSKSVCLSAAELDAGKDQMITPLYDISNVLEYHC